MIDTAFKYDVSPAGVGEMLGDLTEAQVGRMFRAARRVPVRTDRDAAPDSGIVAAGGRGRLLVIFCKNEPPGTGIH